MPIPRPLLPLVAALLAAAGSPKALAEDAAEFFSRRCVSCHTIGGGVLTGPDLKDVTKRAERTWLVTFVQNPQAMIDKGDAYAQKLAKEARGVVMPKIEGMTPGRAAELLDMIEAESRLEKSRFKGTQVSERPFTSADLAQGLALFTGGAPLKERGPACASCHSIGMLGGLGGGTLGPDLSDAFGRLEGRKGLSAWLSAPATPTMSKVFGKRPLDSEEVLALVALMKDVAERREPAPAGADAVSFIALGIAAVGGVLVLLDRISSRLVRATGRPA